MYYMIYVHVTDSWLLFSLNGLMCHDYFQHPWVSLGSEHPAISVKAAIAHTWNHQCLCGGHNIMDLHCWF